ncbi:hypothetical protein, partial [Acetobacter cibinongensis]|uniref:hypothetical protein n=1 Tax=Acetobacter cibinongensis TaxID=146475 RepID=UPI00196B7D94
IGGRKLTAVWPLPFPDFGRLIGRALVAHGKCPSVTVALRVARASLQNNDIIRIYKKQLNIMI